MGRGGLLSAGLVAVGLNVSNAHGEPAFAGDGAFSEGTVKELARSLAQAPFVPPKPPPKAVADIDEEQYRAIRLRPAATLGVREGWSFRLQVLPRGWVYFDPVDISLVRGGNAHHVSYSSDLFEGGTVSEGDIGFSGFRVLYPFRRPGAFEDLALFQGGSYFRCVGRGQRLGLAGRGLTIKTADPAGEEFPLFRAFWVHEPAPNSKELVLDALLDSPGTSGAYRFSIRPGFNTVVDVDVTLFPRIALDKAGLAPLTSMFLLGQNGCAAADDYRPQVHDSDGLLMINGAGEHLWRPLQNPPVLQVSAFVDGAPRGFGLMQRDRDLADYQDFQDHYEERPSLWIEPNGDWGAGEVVLVEIPSNSQIHDNMVAFWRPRTPIPAKDAFHCSYRLFWGDGPRWALSWVRVLATRVGRADVQAPTPVRRFVIDYSRTPGAFSAKDQPQARISVSAGEVKEVTVSENLLTGGPRVSFVWDPKQAKSSELRGELDFTDGRRAETWLYRWTAAAP